MGAVYSKKARKKKPSKDRHPIASWIIPLGLVCLGIVAYCNSLRGPFVYDDVDAITDNKDFGGTIEKPTALTSRPLLWLSFKANYAAVGSDVEAYHATNLLIHLSNGLLLYGIVRRNLLRRETWGERFQTAAPWLAGAVAGIWLVHPLTTAAVTYTIQRAESLASLFYLLVLYSLIRATGSPRWTTAWSCVAIVACALGMATKEIVVTAPLIALIYDRTFLAGSFSAALKTRRWLYAGLAATWGILAILVPMGHGRAHSVGFNLGISATQYALTQLNVIAHYLQLAYWPRGLVLCGGDWPLVQSWSGIGAAGLLLALLLLVSAIAFFKWPRAGFLAAWFFLILAPSSSILPIRTEIEADHRMYLPLAAVVMMTVMACWLAARRWRLTRMAIVLASSVIAVLAISTIIRNNDYQSAVQIWSDCAAKCPNSYVAYYHYGFSLAKVAWREPPFSPQRKMEAAESVAALRRSQKIYPDYFPAAKFLGQMLSESGDMAVADAYDTQLIARFPQFWGEAHLTRGVMRLNLGDFSRARLDFEAILTAEPQSVEAHYFLGVAMQALHDSKAAEAEFQRVVQIDPHYGDAQMRLFYLRSAIGGGSN